MTTGVIINPAAGGGRTGREWPTIRQALERHLGPLVVKETTAQGQAPALARLMAGSGVRLVVAVGGDGTISEVVDGLLTGVAEGRGIDFGIVPAGRGSDLARGLEISGGHDEIAAAIAARPARRLDVGRISFIGRLGRPLTRHFVNIASLGISADIALRANEARNPLRMPGKVVFLWHTLARLARFRAQRVRVTIDGERAFEGDAALIAVANGRYFGGGMMIAPAAATDDGLFDVVIVRSASPPTLALALRKVYGGAHRTLGLCSFHKGRHVLVEPLDGEASPIGLEADGEPPGRAPASFEMLPGALGLRW